MMKLTVILMGAMILQTDTMQGQSLESIKNGDPVTIGCARSGMGKYSYKLFDRNLTSGQINQYNNGCTYIFYKRNIVLEYGGGAVGAQCFPD